MIPDLRKHHMDVWSSLKACGAGLGYLCCWLPCKDKQHTQIHMKDKTAIPSASMRTLNASLECERKGRVKSTKAKYSSSYVGLMTHCNRHEQPTDIGSGFSPLAKKLQHPRTIETTQVTPSKTFFSPKVPWDDTGDHLCLLALRWSGSKEQCNISAPTFHRSEPSSPI